jgi:hypothetical protein
VESAGSITVVKLKLRPVDAACMLEDPIAQAAIIRKPLAFGIDIGRRSRPREGNHPTGLTLATPSVRSTRETDCRNLPRARHGFPRERSGRAERHEEGTLSRAGGRLDGHGGKLRKAQVYIVRNEAEPAVPSLPRRRSEVTMTGVEQKPGGDGLRAVCTKCGQEASVTSTPNGFSYAPDQGAMRNCPVVKERMEREGGRTSNTDCDHMLEAVQSLTDRLRGTIVSQSQD